MKFLFTIILVLVIQSVAAQEYTQKETDIQKLTDELFTQLDLDINYEELYENTVQIFSNPLSLNTATEEEIRFLNILSETQLQSLLSYRKNQNGIMSIYELQSIPNFDLETVRRFAAYVEVDPPVKTSILKNITSKKNTYLIFRIDNILQQKKGFSKEVDSLNKFLGSPLRIYSRFRSSKPGDYSIGFTLEKDAGEALRWKPSHQYYGFDYSSLHVQFQNKGIIKNLIVGDFQGQFGQGLVLGGFFGFGKGAETISAIRRSTIGFIPYTSVQESSMLRGGAVTLKVNTSIDLSFFFSRKRKDANLSEEDSDEYITSFQTSGLHRNKKEMKSRNKFLESNYGAIAEVQYGKMKSGIILSGTSFGNKVRKNRSAYNQFSFTGSDNINASVFSTFSFHNFNFFGELARSFQGGWGGVLGILGSFTPRFDMALLYRQYAPDFQSFYGNALGESGLPQNESGFYCGWKYSWNKKISAAGYFDLFKFHWLRFRSYRPSTGYEWLLRFNYTPDKKTVCYVQYKEEVKERNTSDAGNLYRTKEGVKRSAMVNFKYVVTDDITLKTRIQGSMYQFNKNVSRGLTIVQDIGWKLSPFEFTGRYALFQTDDFDNRQYVYERDAYLAYSFPSYHGKGVRTYMMVEYTVNPHISIWLRYSQTRYSDQDSIGSGSDTIDGNQRNDFRIQLLLRP